jgi:hypothetical protein
MKLDLVNLTDDPRDGPPPVAQLVEARELAWRIGMTITGGQADNPVRVAEAARPMAEWFAEAPTGVDLAVRMTAAGFWLGGTLDLISAGLDPDGSGDLAEAAVHASAGAYAWLTDIPGYGGADSEPRPELTGRQLYVIRCLLLRATEQGTPRPGLTVPELVEGAVEYAGRATPKVTAGEVDAVLRVIFTGDPRDGAPDGPGRAQVGGA